MPDSFSMNRPSPLTPLPVAFRISPNAAPPTPIRSLIAFFAPNRARPTNGMRPMRPSTPPLKPTNAMVAMAPNCWRPFAISSKLIFESLSNMSVNGWRTPLILSELNASLMAGANCSAMFFIALPTLSVNGMSPANPLPMLSAMPLELMARRPLPRFWLMAMAASLIDAWMSFVIWLKARSAVMGIFSNASLMASALFRTAFFKASPLILPSLPSCFSSPTLTFSSSAKNCAICGAFSMMEVSSSPFTTPLPSA